jgi:hypothetical protein
MHPEQINEKIQNLEVKQAITDTVLKKIVEDISTLRVEVKTGFKENRKLMFKGLCWLIGILLTALGYYIKIK